MCARPCIAPAGGTVGAFVFLTLKENKSLAVVRAGRCGQVAFMRVGESVRQRVVKSRSDPQDGKAACPGVVHR